MDSRVSRWLLPSLLGLLAPVLALWPLGLPAFLVALAGALALLADCRRALLARPARFAPALWAVAGLFAWAALSLIWSINAERGALTVLRAGALLLAGVALARMLPALAAETRARAGAALAGVAVLLLGFVVLELASDAGLSRLLRGLGRADVAIDPRMLIDRSVACAAVLGWPLAVALRNRLSTASAVAFLLLLAGALAWHPMRAVGLGFGVGGAVALAVAWAPRPAPRTVIAVVLLAIAVMPLAAGQVYRVLPAFAREDAAYNSWLHRARIWQFAAGRIAERPWLGWGLDAARVIPGGDAAAAGMDAEFTRMPLHPHNGVLQVWLELGAIGALALGALAGLLLRAMATLRADRFAHAAAHGAFASYLTIAALSYGAWQTWWLTTAWLAWALLRVASAPPAAATD